MQKWVKKFFVNLHPFFINKKSFKLCKTSVKKNVIKKHKKKTKYEKNHLTRNNCLFVYERFRTKRHPFHQV